MWLSHVHGPSSSAVSTGRIGSTPAVGPPGSPGRWPGSPPRWSPARRGCPRRPGDRGRVPGRTWPRARSLGTNHLVIGSRGQHTPGAVRTGHCAAGDRYDPAYPGGGPAHGQGCGHFHPHGERVPKDWGLWGPSCLHPRSRDSRRSGTHADMDLGSAGLPCSPLRTRTPGHKYVPITHSEPSAACFFGTQMFPGSGKQKDPEPMVQGLLTSWDRTTVEMGGIEPPSDAALSGLLRVQCAYRFLSSGHLAHE